jgi:hypothetical protein
LALFLSAVDSALKVVRLEKELNTALRHVAEAKAIVASQHLRIAAIKSGHLPTKGDEALLDTFIGTLACLEEHARHLKSELDAAKRGSQKGDAERDDGAGY